MFTHTENNWLYYCYDDDPNVLRRTHSDQSFKIVIKQTVDPILDFRTECIKATRSIKDTYPNEKFSLMFSGGSESEMMLRSFVAAGIDFDVYIGRYKNDLNIYDVSYAVIICESLGVPYKFIDFDVVKFFENDVVEYSLKSQIVIPPLLPQLALCDLVDGLPVMAGGELFIERTDNDYSKKGTWLVTEWEYNWGWCKFFAQQGRLAVADWCRWSPNQFLALTQTNWFDKITNDGYPGKLGMSSTKLEGYREAWPEMIPRLKKHGMEDIKPWMIEISAQLYNAHGKESFGAGRLKTTTEDGYPLILDQYKKNSNFWKPQELLIQAKEGYV
jgi:hypothetical protein